MTRRPIVRRGPTDRVPMSLHHTRKHPRARSWAGAAAAAAACLLVAAAAPPARAQSAASRTAIIPRGGFVRYDRAASIENSGVLAVDAVYEVNEFLAIGPTLTVSRPRTRGEDFLAAFTFGDPTKGDTTFIYAVTQPITLVDVGLGARLGLPVGQRFSPYLAGGVGSYTIYLDAQSNGQPSRFSRLSATVAGGVNVALGSRGGILLDVRDQILTDFQRGRLRPTDSRFENVRFGEELPVPPGEKSTVHNLIFSIGFSFRPGAGSEQSSPDEDDR